MGNEYVEITGAIVHETDDAWLINEGDKQVWVPRSLIDEPRTEVVGHGDNGEDVYIIPIEEWFAKKEGLI